MAIRRELSKLIPSQTNVLKRWVRWKRFETPAPVVLNNPIDMYYIRKENAYNQRIKDAINNENLLVLPWINKNKKDRIYLWEKVGEKLYITDPYNNKRWSIQWAYGTFNNGEHSNFDLADLISNKYKWTNFDKRNKIELNLKKMWDQGIFGDEDWTTLQSLFDNYPDWTSFDDDDFYKLNRKTVVPSSNGKRKYS